MRRRRSCLLALALASSAAAQSQVRVVPAEAGASPLAGAAVAASIPSQAPLSAAPLASALSGGPLFVAAPSPAAVSPAAAPGSPSAARAARAEAAAAPASAPAPAAAVERLPALGIAASDGANVLPSPVQALAARTAAPSSRSRTGPRAASAPRADLDALFDGSAARSAAEDGPAPAGRESPGAALPPSVARRAHRAFSVGVPLAAAAGVALGVVSPPLAMAALHGLGQASYWLANPLAFLFTVPQIHRILSRRSAEVSLSMTAVGLFSALVTTLCFAFDGKDLMMYRNLAQTAGFAAMLGLEYKYGRGAKNPAPSRPRALLETGAVVLALGAILIASGPLLMAVVPSIALMSSLLVPFQILSGFGFTFMMYAQLKKMSLEQSAGDSSAGMMWAYLGTKVIWVWSFATMLSLVTAPAWLVLAAGAAFAGVCWLASGAVLSHLLRTPWSFLPEKISLRGRTLTRRALGDAAAFVALAALILALSCVGHLAFATLLGVKAGAYPLFAMYLLYTVQNLVAALATSKTLKLHAAFGQKTPSTGS